MPGKVVSHSAAHAVLTVGLPSGQSTVQCCVNDTQCIAAPVCRTPEYMSSQFLSISSLHTYQCLGQNHASQLPPGAGARNPTL